MVLSPVIVVCTTNLVVAFAEDGCADADDGAAFGDGYAVVVGHAHGDFGEVGGVGECGAAQVVEEGADAAEFGADEGVVVDEGCHAHDAADAQVGVGGEEVGGDEGGGFVGCEALFGVFAGDVELDEDVLDFVDAGGAAFDFGDESLVGYAVYECGVRDDHFDFVGLEVADEVPPDVGGELGGFGDEFLRSAFAKVAFAGGVGLADGFGGVEFGDADESDAGGYVAADLGEIVFDCHWCVGFWVIGCHACGVSGAS